MTIKTRKSLTNTLGITIAIISITGSAFAWHNWHKDKLTNFLYEKIQQCILPIDCKLDVIMTKEQRIEAAALLRIRKEELTKD
jgi:hypothetical protein